jgi:hypothetical protein
MYRLFCARLGIELKPPVISTGDWLDPPEGTECYDMLLTENKDHFERLPNLKDKVMAPKEFCREFDQR